MTYGANSDKCPVCRIVQRDYVKNRKLELEIQQKWVKCPEPGCALRCTLSEFLQHSHGVKHFGANADLSNIRRPRPPPLNMLSSSPLRIGIGGRVSEVSFSLITFCMIFGDHSKAVCKHHCSPYERSIVHNYNVWQGRNLLQDMMLVLNMEMELRRRAVRRLQTAAHEQERSHHLDEILAIQTQMQQVATFLDLLFGTVPGINSM